MIPDITLQQRTVFGIYSILGALIGITLLCCLWQWHHDWSSYQHPVHAGLQSSREKPTDLIAAIPEEHLFGQSLSGDMPLTSLQMRVTGIVMVEDALGRQLSKAYISMSGQASKIYQVGDSLPYGVRVHGITSNAVVLENDGKLEKLALPREPLQFKARLEV